MSELRPATMGRILVIEKDRALQRMLQRHFSSSGYEIDIVADGVASLEMLRQRPLCSDPRSPVCRIFVLGSLEETCGFDSWSAPCNFLVQSSDVAEKALLLQMGADDYVTIPFSPRELVEPLRSLIRRASPVRPENWKTRMCLRMSQLQSL